MQYKTIVLELLDGSPLLSERLKASNSLLSTMEAIAIQLRNNHLHLVDRMQRQNPDQKPEIFKTQTLEQATLKLQEAIDQLIHLDLQAMTPSQLQAHLLKAMSEPS